jgi:hypothetical protein
MIVTASPRQRHGFTAMNTLAVPRRSYSLSYSDT